MLPTMLTRESLDMESLSAYLLITITHSEAHRTMEGESMVTVPMPPLLTRRTVLTNHTNIAMKHSHESLITGSLSVACHLITDIFTDPRFTRPPIITCLMARPLRVHRLQAILIQATLSSHHRPLPVRPLLLASGPLRMN